jgi:hypothetical protein
MKAITHPLAAVEVAGLRKASTADLVAHLRAIWNELDRRNSLTDLDDDLFCATGDAIDRFCHEAGKVLEAREPEGRFVGTFEEWLA